MKLYIVKKEWTFLYVCVQLFMFYNLYYLCWAHMPERRIQSLHGPSRRACEGRVLFSQSFPGSAPKGCPGTKENIEKQ